MRSLAAAVAAATKRPDHGLTIWMRDWHGKAWAWSCLCGRRYGDDLPTREAARDEGMQHQRPVTVELTAETPSRR